MQGTIHCSKRHIFQWKTLLQRLLHKSATLRISETGRSYRCSKRRIFVFSSFNLTTSSSKTRCALVQLHFASADSRSLNSIGLYFSL
jgi:hypothetical protein